MIAQRLLMRRAASMQPLQFGNNAVVFAPHPDDETLACGGTIARLRQAGADVTVVVMTDGAASHSHLLPAADLRTLRRAEVGNAIDALHVDRAHLLCLNLPDGNLAAHSAQAHERVVALLRARQPSVIFLPLPWDGPTDHAATAHIVSKAARAALSERGSALLCCEYPVWAWCSPPWIAPHRLRSRWALQQALKGAVRTQLGLRLLHALNRRVDVGDVLVQKRRALDQHRSQMTRLNGDLRWSTLVDVAGGSFLDRLLQPHEFFRVTQIVPEG